MKHLLIFLYFLKGIRDSLRLIVQGSALAILLNFGAKLPSGKKHSILIIGIVFGFCY
jgi:hypothetical protein